MSKSNNRIISTPEAATPELLTSVLRRKGIDAQVSSVDVILRKELQVSRVFRLGIGYKDRMDEYPRSLFLKLPRVLTEATGMVPGDHRTEVEFYRDVAAGMSCPPLIRCYDAAFDDETGRSHILMDDLMDTHSQPDQNNPPSEEMSRLAVEALGQVHAAWWNGSTSDLGLRLSNFGAWGNGVVLENARQFNDEWLANFVENLKRNVAEFREVAEFTPGQELMYKQMLDAAPMVWGRLTDPGGLTVTHGDMHWWNFLYPNEPARNSVHIFDWHTWHVDLGARDLAFLLALGGFAEPRPALEEELLRVYHNALAVDGYSFEMLIKDYRWSAIRNLNIPVIFWKQGKHYSTWQTTLRRACEAYERLECAELL